MSKCPYCNSPLCNYKSGDYTDSICWACGYYESDSPAYRLNTTLFKNLVRDNPTRFMQNFLCKPADGFLQRKRNAKDFTEPVQVIYMGGYGFSELLSAR